MKPVEGVNDEKEDAEADKKPDEGEKQGEVKEVEKKQTEDG